ncbi:hypothetical protein BJY00DRAFT_147394 [Aspergillus carlsbadensis]|nr:hypothetical protein BJY00DRAFT_147394 [Aspergillus carlsbadensis]
MVCTHRGLGRTFGVPKILTCISSSGGAEEPGLARSEDGKGWVCSFSSKSDYPNGLLAVTRVAYRSHRCGMDNRILCKRGPARRARIEVETGSRPTCIQTKSLCSSALNTRPRATAAKDWGGKILERGRAQRRTSPGLERCRWIKRDKSPIWRICTLVKLSLQQGRRDSSTEVATPTVVWGCYHQRRFGGIPQRHFTPLHRAVLVQRQGHGGRENNNNNRGEQERKASKRVRKTNYEGRGMKRSARQKSVSLEIVLGPISQNAIRDQQEAGGDPSPFHSQS